jgi:hypothetical protein
MIKPDHVILKPLELVYKKNLEEFGQSAYKTLRFYQQSLMHNSGGSSEDQSINRNVNSKSYAHGVTDGNEDSIGN